MAELGTDTAAVQAGEVEAKVAQEAADAATATAAAETAGDERSEEQKAADTAAQAEASEKERKARAQDKIDRTVRIAKTEAAKEREARHKIEVEKARVEGELAAIKAQGGKRGDAVVDPNAPPVRPKLDDFETQGEFQEATIEYMEKRQEWLISQEREKINKDLAAQRRPVETPAQAKERVLIEKWVDAQDKVEAEFGPEAREIITSMDFVLTESMADSILERDTASKILGYLAENREVGKKIAGMSLTNQIREIDKLESAITTKRNTSAPPPIPRVDGKGGNGVGKPPEKMNAEELAALMYGK